MRTRVAVAIAAAVLGSLGACKRGELAYEKTQQLGFSIDLPKSPDMAGLGNAGRTSYAAGTIKRGQSRSPRHVVAVAWQIGVLSTDEELTQLIAIMASALVGKVTPERVGTPRHDTVGGQPAIRITFRIAPLDLELVEIMCGARAIQVTVGADDPAPIMTRMLASFACQPDPTREAELASNRAPVGFDDLTGWHLAAGDEADGFQITNDTTLAYFAAMPDARAIDQLGFAKTLAAMMEVSWGSWTALDTIEVTRHGHTREISFGRTTLDGAELELGAAMWACPGHSPVFGFALDASGEAASAAAREATIDVLLRARCLRPGEEPPTFERAAADQ